MPLLLPTTIMDRQDVNLPEATSKTFWLHGSPWQFPDFENPDTFVDRLVRDGLLVHDSVASAARQDEPTGLTPRTVQRRLLQETV